MKKLLIIISLLFTSLLFVSCNKTSSPDEILNKVENYFYFPIEVTDDLEFPASITISGKEINLVWETSNNAISEEGKVERGNTNIDVLISVNATLEGKSKHFDLITVTVLKKAVITTYTIKYDLDGGTANNLITSYQEGEEVALPTPIKDGFVFIGWYQDNTLVSKITTGNYNLHAKYRKEGAKLNVTFSDEVIYVGSESYINIEGYKNLSAFDITSSDESVAYVDSEYFLIGLKKGKTNITFTLREDPVLSATIEVEVLNKIPVIFYNGSPIKINDTFDISLSRYSDSNLFDITYDNEYLNFDGSHFTALKEGATTITYTLKEDSAAQATLDIVIYPTKPVLYLSSKDMTVGTTTRIDVLNYNSEDFYDISLSGADAILNGRIITALARGDIRITVTLKNNTELSSYIDVHVAPLMPIVTLTQNNIIVGGSTNIYFDNLEELDDKDLNNYVITLSDNEVASLNDLTLTGKKIGNTVLTITNKNDNEIIASNYLNVIDNTITYDEENEIASGKLYLYHKNKDDFDGYIHAGLMDYFGILGAHDYTKYNWISSNTKVLVIFEDGRYIAVAQGSATIQVTRKDNNDVVGRLNIKVYGEPDVDYIGRLIAIATSQLGYVEGPDNDTKYGRWYGIPNGEWCAMFVSWCANQAGISTDIIPKYAGCTVGREWFESRGLFRYKEEYVPKAGDIIFFLSDGAGHTGIVINCDGSRVYTIEGNTSDMCAKRNYSLNWHTITGYGTPNYPPYSGSSSSGDTSGSTEGGSHSTH